MLCCGYTLTDFPISNRLTSLALWQSNDCPSASKATLMNMDKYFMWIHYERLHNHIKAKHNKTVCIFLGIYCTYTNNETNSIVRSLQWSIMYNNIKVLKTFRSFRWHFHHKFFFIKTTVKCILGTLSIVRSTGNNNLDLFLLLILSHIFGGMPMPSIQTFLGRSGHIPW